MCGKLVDWIVGGGAHLQGRRFALYGETAFGGALREALADEGITELRKLEGPEDPALVDVDVLVLCDPARSEVPFVEHFIDATRRRQLPPEVWVVHERAEDGVARHYYDDVRVLYRTVVLPDAADVGDGQARRAARVALFFIRRGLHFVPTVLAPGAGREFRRFRRGAPTPPLGAVLVQARAERAAA